MILMAEKVNFYVTNEHEVSFSFRCFMFIIIIWHGSLKVNLSILIVSHLVHILPCGPFPKKCSRDVDFWSQKPTNSK